VVAFQTDDPVEAVSATLAAIEADNGRTRAEARLSPRTLDLDLLLYGDLVTTDGEDMQLPREEITRHSFVLKPLADLAGERSHPRLGRSFRQLWEEFDDGDHELVQVTVDFATEGMP
jgi:2-amino-4-hydroxy-6-hydroxymethyldihydropteridine diphosphokinase